jgi:GT2 family glycosyltransferase
MTFWKILARVALLRPLESSVALWWQLLRRRVRARNILKAAAADLPIFYDWWIKDVEPARLATSEVTGAGPVMTLVVLPGSNGLKGIDRSLHSVGRQWAASWDILVPAAAHLNAGGDSCLRNLPSSARSEADLLEAAIAEAREGFLIALRAGDELASWAIACFQEAMASDPATLVIYGDHDHLEQGGRSRPWFKPDWDEEHFLAIDYVSRGCALRVSAAREAAINQRPESLFELVLAIAHRRTDGIVHLPHVVMHAASPEDGTSAAARARAVERQVRVPGLKAEEGAFASVRVQWPLPEPSPLVTIVIPTRDKLELVEACVRSILSKTSYGAYELLIVDNGSSEGRTLTFFRDVQRDARVRVLAAPIPYNYSALNNLAVAQSRGTFVCLLNNDTEVVNADWLTELMRHAVRSDVGAVGAKLLYGDGTIQHAGVVVGMGDAAGHIHRNVPNDEAGYFAHPHIARSVMALTGACLLVAKDKYLAVGGLDEEALAIAYNDIDFCLKLQAAGWRNIYAPQATLIHHESKSRAKDHTPSQIQRYTRELQTFQNRWGTRDFLDPSFNPNLDPTSERVVVRLT